MPQPTISELADRVKSWIRRVLRPTGKGSDKSKRNSSPKINQHGVYRQSRPATARCNRKQANRKSLLELPLESPEFDIDFEKETSRISPEAYYAARQNEIVAAAREYFERNATRLERHLSITVPSTARVGNAYDALPDKVERMRRSSWHKLESTPPSTAEIKDRINSVIETIPNSDSEALSTRSMASSETGLSKAGKSGNSGDNEDSGSAYSDDRFSKKTSASQESGMSKHANNEKVDSPTSPSFTRGEKLTSRATEYQDEYRKGDDAYLLKTVDKKTKKGRKSLAFF
ncbi:hypothetical protein K402DRAFT_466970 [Aulographum hederae CBS 113979]|uniref:Uncharacterized protein n=1 Tax=Aulographum hederae CBS 113979 TaxID=1176131 RepID=A0A6G1GN99_9PEZI|nr:hypothetical protein K402DRAFT_466970 [Aulographum hederae CBS 113979]